MQCALVNTYNAEEVIPRVIVNVTGAQFGNHSLLRFRSEATEIYFESHYKKDPKTGKTGVRGPMLYSRVLQWRDANPEKHIIYEQPWLPLESEAVLEIFKFLSAAVIDIEYAPAQILRNYACQRLGVTVRFGRHASDDRWTCSEMVARALVHANLEFLSILGLGEITYDDMVPSSPKSGGLYEALQKYLESLDPSILLPFFPSAFACAK